MSSKSPSPTPMPHPTSKAPFDHLTLEHRLDDGYRRIEEARLRGVDVRAWEEFWLQLLAEYEEVCDGLRLAAA